MKPVWIFNIVGGLVAVALAGAYYVELGPFGSPLVRACESALVKRLKTPSTYARKAVQQSDRALTADEFQEARLAKRNLLKSSVARDALQEQLNIDMRVIRSSATPPRLYTARIEYDAQNGYGALIRASADCAFMPANGKLKGVTELNVEVDGEDQFEFLGRQLREAG